MWTRIQDEDSAKQLTPLSTTVHLNYSLSSIVFTTIRYKETEVKTHGKSTDNSVKPAKSKKNESMVNH
jgi:hypothetical protein